MNTEMSPSANSSQSIVIGTPGFMPMEQIAGRPLFVSDLYSLGLTVICLLTGKIPQDLPTDPNMGNILWRHFVPYLNVNFGDILDKAISYNPRDRYLNAREMLTALQTLSNPVAPAFVPTPAVIPVTSPLSIENTIAVSPGNDAQNSYQTNQNTARGGIILASIIASGLIGASIIIGFAINKSPLPIESSNNKNTSVSSSASQENQKTALSKNIDNPINSESPLPPSSAKTETNISHVSISNTSPINTTNATTKNYFWISQRRVTETDLAGKDGYELDIMRNTVFAVKGRRFDTPGLQEYFNQQSWYNPRYSPKQFPMSLLSKLEQQNVEYIAKYQDRNNLRYFKK
jgi:serine/threonine-protein kinase